MCYRDYHHSQPLGPYHGCDSNIDNPSDNAQWSHQQAIPPPSYHDTIANETYASPALQVEAYSGPNAYPGDLSTSQDLALSDRAFSIPNPFKGVKIPSFNEVLPILAPIVVAPLIPLIPVLGPILPVAYPVVVALSETYIAPMRKQLNDGRARNLPRWLYRFCTGKYPNIDLSRVRYGENIQFKSLNADNAMTIGYNIYFPRTIDLDLNNPAVSAEPDVHARLWTFAQSVQWILHEMEHCSQYNAAGANDQLWVAKYIAQAGFFFKPGGDTSGAMQLERDAEAKAWSLYSDALKWFSRSRQTVPGMLYTVMGLHPHDGSAGRPLVYGNFREGEGLVSSDGRFVFRIQADGNLVVYAPGNIPVWQSHSYGTACPPFRLVSSRTRDAVVLTGYTFEAPSHEPILSSIWQSPPFRTAGSNSGGFIFVDTAATWLRIAIGLDLVLSNHGQLQARLTFSNRQPLVIWESPLAQIITETIQSTTVLLPRI